MVADVFWKLKSTEMQNNDTSKYLIIIFWSGRLSYVTILLLVIYQIASPRNITSHTQFTVLSLCRSELLWDQPAL